MEVRLNARAAAVFEKVSKSYLHPWTGRATRALDGVSLTIPWGMTYGLIGPNRAGKTTLVKILLSICHPTDGRIMRLERPWSDRGSLAEIGYVHENPSFPGYLNARQIVEGYGMLAGVPRDVARERASSLLARVGLADRTRDKITQFSKGMLQRLALAQALVNDPRLLVLDEPSEGMDLPARRLLDEVIGERRARGFSVVLVSHSLADVGRLCDRVAVLREGRLAFEGPVSELSGEWDGHPTAAFEDAVESLYAGAAS